MAKVIKDTLTRKLDIKEAYFDGDDLMVSIDKDEEPVAMDLIKDLKELFGENNFNISVTMKSEKDVEPTDTEE